MSRAPGVRRVERCAVGGTPGASRRQCQGRWRAESSSLRAQAEGVLGGAQEAVAAGDFFGEGGDQAFAIDSHSKRSLNAGQEIGDVEGSAGLLKYVIGHINLRQT